MRELKLYFDKISGLSEALDLEFTNNLFILIDNHGNLLEIWGKVNSKLNFLVPVLQSHANVFELIEETDNAFQHNPDTIHRFNFRANLPVIGKNQGLYSNLPTVTLQAFPCGNHEWLGVIRRSELFPAFQYSSAHLVFFMDRQGRLCAYNGNFNAAFNPDKTDPNALLNRSIREFISPDPLEIQRQYLQLTPQGELEWPTRLFSETELTEGRASRYTPASVVRRQTGWEWHNASDDTDFIVFSPELNLIDYDFDFRIEIAENGLLPLLIAGNPKRTQGDPYPDTEGYLAGYVTGQELHLKKQGYLLHCFATPHPEGPSSLALRKIGKSLTVFLNNTPVLTYYDPEFLHNPRTAFSLAMLPGERCLIKNVRVICRPSQEREPGVHVLRVQARNEAGRYFLLNRFHTTALGTKYKDLWGFNLIDVTFFQSEAEIFRRSFLKGQDKPQKPSNLAAARPPALWQLTGTSAAMQRVRAQAQTVASSSAALLIQGETGTGKNVLAGAVHRMSVRKDKPLIKLDCSTIPHELIESELFGYEPGAFTGALQRKIGRLEEANHGTLLLDEIANLDLRLQAKLLNVLQDFQITRLGGTTPIPLDVRLISATNIELQSLIQAGRFRKDLYYRLNVISISMPPLRDHKEDIPELCWQFMAEFNRALGKDVQEILPKTFEKLYAHSWPGNVRELRNVIHNAMVFCEGPALTPELIRLETGVSLPRPLFNKSGCLRDWDAQKLTELARRHHGRVSAMARELGVTRVTCYHNLRKWGIDIPAYRKKDG